MLEVKPAEDRVEIAESARENPHPTSANVGITEPINAFGVIL